MTAHSTVRWRIIVAVVALSAGCGGNGGGGTGGRPLEAEITDAIHAFWQGTSVPEGVPILFAYEYADHEDTDVCQHLAPRDRWFAQRTSLVEPGKLEQSAMTTAAVAYLEGEGFTLSRWKTSAADAPVINGFIGHRDQTAIQVDVTDEGRTDLTVRMGPCATPTLDGFTEPLYQRIQ
jgi:hypothetical protein